MVDREKVIKGLEHCLSRYVDGLCDDCPYMGELDKSYMIPMKCKEIIMRDALSLLKEQKTGHWIYLENCSNSGVYCSECNTKVFDNYPFKKKFSYFCPHCGTRMEGETERR